MKEVLEEIISKLSYYLIIQFIIDEKLYSPHPLNWAVNILNIYLLTYRLNQYTLIAMLALILQTTLHYKQLCMQQGIELQELRQPLSFPQQHTM
jgi:hypothetical protein